MTSSSTAMEPVRSGLVGYGFGPAFARAVRRLGPVPVDGRDAVATATVLDAARESATSGAVVRIPG